MLGWWRHYWRDERLDWKPDQWGGVDFVAFLGTGENWEVWSPDDLIYESQETYDIIDAMDYSVYPGGYMFFSKPVIHTIPCSMEMSLFPFDTQACSFSIGSWSNHGYLMDVKPRLVDGAVSASNVDTYVENTEFWLVAIVSTHDEFYYSCCPEPYPYLSYTLHLGRHPLTYFNGIIMPMVVTTYAGFLSFFMNPMAGERIGLNITVLLVIGVFYLIAVEMMPKSREWNPISWLNIYSTIVSVIALLTSIVNVSLFNIRDSTGHFSETSLLNIFMEADIDHSGDLDLGEIKAAVDLAGMRPAQRKLFDKLLANQGGGILK